ncbi:carboxylesterase family protein [Saccharomonospora sp. NPDC006951]
MEVRLSAKIEVRPNPPLLSGPHSPRAGPRGRSTGGHRWPVALTCGNLFGRAAIGERSRIAVGQPPSRPEGQPDSGANASPRPLTHAKTPVHLPSADRGARPRRSSGRHTRPRPCLASCRPPPALSGASSPMTTGRSQGSRTPRHSPVNGAAFHGGELQYLFDGAYGTGALAAEQRRLSDRMVRYWSAFVRSGQPSDPGMPWWPRFHDSRQPVLSLDTGPGGSTSPASTAVSSGVRSARTDPEPLAKQSGQLTTPHTG